jgi:hypothetical protein
MASQHNQQHPTTRQDPIQPNLFERKRLIRISKKKRVYELFREHLYQKFSSYALHEQFGSAVRTRISEINRDPGLDIRIRNRVQVEGNKEISWYWSERRS